MVDKVTQLTLNAGRLLVSLAAQSVTLSVVGRLLAKKTVDLTVETVQALLNILLLLSQRPLLHVEGGHRQLQVSGQAAPFCFQPLQLMPVGQPPIERDQLHKK